MSEYLSDPNDDLYRAVVQIECLRGRVCESHGNARETHMNNTQESKRAKHVAMNRILCQEAQGLVEYAFLIVLVALIVIVALALFGQGVGNMFSNIMSNI